jgi:hypothetical protein
MHGQFNIPIIGPETRRLGDTSAWDAEESDKVKREKSKIERSRNKKEKKSLKKCLKSLFK